MEPKSRPFSLRPPVLITASVCLRLTDTLIKIGIGVFHFPLSVKEQYGAGIIGRAAWSLYAFRALNYAHGGGPVTAFGKLHQAPPVSSQVVCHAGKEEPHSQASSLAKAVCKQPALRNISMMFVRLLVRKPTAELV